jgi:RNA polymerase primary sigma factor
VARLPGSSRDTGDAPARPGAFDHYLRDIGAFPLLSLAQEADLARRIRTGDRDAIDTLVRANLRFVVSVARRYRTQAVPLSDLVNEGNIGLLRAVHRFDGTKGVRFISYAVWWIRQAILQALAEQSCIVRVPLNRVGARTRARAHANALLQRLGREPRHAEIAEAMGLGEAEVADAMSFALPHVSLDAPTTPGESGCRLDHLADEDGAALDEQLLARALTEAVTESLSALTDREATILRLYFGLADEEPLTLEQIGAAMGVTRERVRQIKERALARLRYARRAQSLASFLG